MQRSLLQILAKVKGWRRHAIIFAAATVLYFGLDSLCAAGLRGSWTVLWPLNGLTVALLLVSARKRWPSIMAGVVLGTTLADLQFYPLASIAYERPLSAIGVLLTTSVLPPFHGIRTWLQAPRLVHRLVLGLFLGPALSAAGYATCIVTSGLPAQTWLAAFDDWFGSDALGIVLCLPLILTLGSSETRALYTPRALPRTLLMLLLPPAVTATVLVEVNYPLLFLLYPALLWTDARLRLHGAALAMMLSALAAIALTMHGYGRFATVHSGALVNSTLSLQLILGFHAVALLPFSARSTAERQMAGELRAANAQLEALAGTDSLTTIANRRFFGASLSREWRIAFRGATPVALMMVDIDHFKRYNDTYGHPAGDSCLRAVSQILAGFARRAGDVAARVGGEEFAVLFPGVTLEECLPVAEQLRAAVESAQQEHRGSPAGWLTVSVGVAAHVPRAGEPEALLLELADRALYTAKGTGRNRVASAEKAPAAAFEGVSATFAPVLVSNGGWS